MILNIDFDSETPIYTQVSNQIIKGIACQELTEGEKLPTVRQLASDIGVNLHTINKAYNNLKIRGFLSINRRKGVVINSKDSFAYDTDYLDELKENLSPLIYEAISRDVDSKLVINLVNELYQTVEEGK